VSFSKLLIFEFIMNTDDLELIANFDELVGGHATRSVCRSFQAAAFLHRSAAALSADNLPCGLWLRRCRFDLCALRSVIPGFFTLRGRLPDFLFFASVVVADFVSGATRNFRAPVAISPEPMIAG
jgi:hypothetical protein